MIPKQKKEIFKSDSANTVHTCTGFGGQNIHITFSDLPIRHKLRRAPFVIIQYKCTNKVKSCQKNLVFQTSFRFTFFLSFFFFQWSVGIHNNFLMPSNFQESVSAYCESTTDTAAMRLQMLHIKMNSLCFNVVAAVLALAVLVCVHGTALSVPRSCLE